MKPSDTVCTRPARLVAVFNLLVLLLIRTASFLSESAWLVRAVINNGANRTWRQYNTRWRMVDILKSYHLEPKILKYDFCGVLFD